MDLIQLRKLEATAGQVLKHYHELLRQADASMHDSPAARAKAEFERDWVNDPEAVTRVVEQEAKVEEQAKEANQ
jgi:hypothetical protein